MTTGGSLRTAHNPGWKRLWWHSYALGTRWLIRDARRGWPARRVGFARLLVPLDPWRYYELGLVADEEFSGRCLDVSSPKLLPSLLQSEGKGTWTCVDLFEEEIVAWRTIDARLDLRVEDATALSFDDASFDHCICISVLEHIGVGRDSVALAELWRVLRPGGVLHLTTDVSLVPRDVFTEERAYGNASPTVEGGRAFFKHDYAPAEVERLIADLPWEVRQREYAVQRKPGIERWFYAHAPWSYFAGPLLRFVCADNFETSPAPVVCESTGTGVVYLKLRKPDKRTSDERA